VENGASGAPPLDSRRQLSTPQPISGGGGTFHAGCGMGDVTGPIDGVGMMGYAVPWQTSRGLWQRYPKP